MIVGYLLPVFLSVLTLLAAVSVAALVWVALSARLLALPFTFDETHVVTTHDGARCVLLRIRPNTITVSARPPVLLCHGLAMNRRAFALDPTGCFARRLADSGRDVWLLELRGASSETQGPSLRNSTFDSYLDGDLPAAIATVLERTGAVSLDWVGFSMGGMLAYAYLGALRGTRIRRLVTIGSPVRFDTHWLRRGPGVLPLLVAPFKLFSRVPFRFLALLPALLMTPWLPAFVTRGLRARQYSAPMLRRVMANALHDIPSGVAFQFVRWLKQGRFDSNDGTRDYFSSLAEITLPTLVISGDRDALAPKSSVRAAFDRISSPEREYLCVGPDTGAQDHYDHLDLILGRHALEEVFPAVSAWLDKP